MDTEQLMLTLCEFLDLSKNAPIKDVLFDAFKQAITLGRVPAGTSINEKQLAQSLHISRTPIRAALDMLAADRLVDRKPGSGVIVRGISKRDAEEVYEIRVVLEVLATTKAAHNMTDEDFEEMRQLLEEGQRLNAANDVDGVVNNWDEFNQFIFAKANSPRLQSIIEPLQAYTRYFRNVSAKPELRRNQALEEHWGIYLAMRFGPEKKIEQVVRAHLRNSYGLVNEEMTDCGIV
ncbi:GntR family transcriptional regulator [Collinsella tanakaei]|uniref:GntR family transcriptional regulator n=1 Tax=Collinsella tanakaei TaxID=626935 RepID=UPI00195BF7F5|nr:GntR family transcriptional regulator [Collinsella tanakaei]MBM6778331.1 GntR family transcriptional regulator [Collinsella tanakaei]